MSDKIREALELFMQSMDRHGNWDDGCFYYGATSASEFQRPMELARAALAAAPPSRPVTAGSPSVDAVRQTIADEWGSHVCYHDIVGSRICDTDEHCRCADIARAVVSQHAIGIPSASAASSEVVPAIDPEPDAGGARAISAIKAWQANRQTTYTPAGILHDYGDVIIAALAPPAAAGREEIALIIDPTARFVDIEGVSWSRFEIERRELAYQKADAILALGSTVSPQDGWCPIEDAPVSIRAFAKAIETDDDRNSFIEYCGTIEDGRPFVLMRKDGIERVFDRYLILPHYALPRAEREVGS